MPEYIYRFSLGNSTTGQVGLCFDLHVTQERTNKAQAVRLAREALANQIDDPLPVPNAYLSERMRGAVVYVNADKLTERDIVDITTA